MTCRRLLLQQTASLCAMLATPGAFAQQKRPITDPLRVGVDDALVDAGLARALQQGFGRDTGIAVQLVRRPSLPLLEALERGELDVALSNTPDAEVALERQGLAHDRHPVARGEFVIAGPAPRGNEKDPAGIAGLRDAAQALVLLRAAALAAPGAVLFLSSAEGSGTHAAEQALWRRARLAPGAPWYAVAEAATPALAQARARRAYVLVERGAWAAAGGSPLAVLVEGDPALVEVIHAQRAFRVNHPAGKFFVAWIAGPKGRRVVAAQRAYRPLDEAR